MAKSRPARIGSVAGFKSGCSIVEHLLAAKQNRGLGVGLGSRKICLFGYS